MMKKNQGFTLIELMVAMVIASIVMTVVVAAYQLQVRSKNLQAVLTDMNQTARAALEIMTSEISKAGFDPNNDPSNAGILIAQANRLAFSMDIGDQTQPPATRLLPDGFTNDPNERVRYALTGTGHLGRTTGLAANGTGGGVAQPLARNVNALDFVYLDSQNVVIPTPVAANRLADIRSIEVTIVARAGEAGGAGFTGRHNDNTVYQNQRGNVILPAQNDSFRRLRLTTTIQTRNIGI